MDDLSRFCCLNSECPDHGKHGAGNLTVTSRYGPGKSRRMLRCRARKARFSERKGTPLSDARLPPRSRTTWTTLFGHPVQAGCGATFTPQGRASRTRLNGVAVARRKRVNPPAITTSRSRASPAWAPRANPTS